jgi:putative phosphoserine phosphatase/1-acylglycerol-3-phosphate O-acyltransferase
MAEIAAIFDLDRTLLKKASGPLLNEALVDAGLVPGRSLPGMGLLYRVNDVLGETLPMMALARCVALVSRGWPVETVRDAARQATDRLVTNVAPYALPLLEDHRAAGHRLVLATTTPHDLVEPLAQRLGFEDVVATRYAERDGTYTGRLTGEFVWARGKVAAVRRWAETEGVDLAASYAYSDSVYDVPLLSAVGRPTAVNPDPRLQVVAAVRRWPTLHLDAPPGVPKVIGLEPLDLLRAIAVPPAFPYARFDISGVERIPRRGGVILAANHRSYFDPIAIGMATSRTGRLPRFLAKKELFEAPVVGQAMQALGQIRVDRGESGANALREAERALEAGELLAIMPQGTIPRGERFLDPVLKGKTGVARLAAATGAPVIPMGIWGSEHVWPRSAKVPNMLALGHPPTVRVRVGPAIALTLDDARGDTGRIMAAIVDQLPAEARNSRFSA